MTNPNETGLSTDPKSLKNEYKAVRKEFLDGFGKFYCKGGKKINIIENDLKTDCNHNENNVVINNRNVEFTTYMKNILTWLDPKMNYYKDDPIFKSNEQINYKTSIIHVGEETSESSWQYKTSESTDKDLYDQLSPLILTDECVPLSKEILSARLNDDNSVKENNTSTSILEENLKSSQQQNDVLEKSDVENVKEKHLKVVNSNSQKEEVNNISSVNIISANQNIVGSLHGPEADLNMIYKKLVNSTSCTDITDTQMDNLTFEDKFIELYNDCINVSNISSTSNDCISDAKVISSGLKSKNNKFNNVEKLKPNVNSQSIEKNKLEKTSKKPLKSSLRGKRLYSIKELENTPKKKKFKASNHITVKETSIDNGIDSVKSPIHSSVKIGKNVYNRNKKGETTLHAQCSKGNLNMVKSLLDQGFNPNVKDNAGWTPLHEAVKTGHLDIVKKLIDYGAYLEAPGFEYETPLHVAVKYGKFEIARILLQNGADKKCINIYGKNPESLDTEMWSKLLCEQIPCTPSKIERDYKSDQITVYLSNILLNDTVSKFSEKFNIKIVKNILNENQCIQATHIVISSKNDTCDVNLECLYGIGNGLFIVKQNWILDSLEQNKLLDCQNYEVKGTEYYIDCDGPKIARLNKQKLHPKLFDGINVHIHGNLGWKQFSLEHIKKLIHEYGGKYLVRMPNPEDCPIDIIPYHCRNNESMYHVSTIVFYTTESKRLIKYNMKHLKVFHISWFLEAMQKHTMLKTE